MKKITNGLTNICWTFAFGDVLEDINLNKSYRSHQAFSKKYSVAEISVDTAGNELLNPWTTYLSAHVRDTVPSVLCDSFAMATIHSSDGRSISTSNEGRGLIDCRFVF